MLFTSDERNLMDALPMKLRKDLAIHVHFNTLSKVKLFQDCDKTLLYDLVLKLKPVLYLPNDYVCRKVSHNTAESCSVEGRFNTSSKKYRRSRFWYHIMDMR